MITFRIFPNASIKPQVIKCKDNYIFTKNRKILDFTAGSTCHAILGWQNKKVLVGMKKQLNKFAHIDYKAWSDPNVEELAELLTKNTKHKLDKVYFSGNSGAEACEAAMKMSYQVNQDLGYKNKNWFISHEQSYHGSTTDALSISDRPNLKFYRKLQPYNRSLIKMHHPLKLKKKYETLDQYAIRSAKYLEKEILRIGPNRVCGYVGEPIMGGLIGDVPPAPNYWKYIRKICTKYKVHLILDEVYCGTGTSGKVYCCDWDDIKPDFIFLGKTLAAGYGVLSAVITKKEYEKIISDKSGRLFHTTTHQAHSLSLAATLEVQKIIANRNFLSRVFNNGKYMRSVLHEELHNHPFFQNVRGRGFRFSLEYKCKKRDMFGRKLAREIFDKNNILFSIKWHRANFTPSLTMTKKQIDQAMDVFIKKFKQISKKFN